MFFTPQYLPTSVFLIAACNSVRKREGQRSMTTSRSADICFDICTWSLRQTMRGESSSIHFVSASFLWWFSQNAFCWPNFIGLLWRGRATSRLHIGHQNARSLDIVEWDAEEISNSSQTHREIERDFSRLPLSFRIEVSWSMILKVSEPFSQARLSIELFAISCIRIVDALELILQGILSIVLKEARGFLSAALSSETLVEMCETR